MTDARELAQAALDSALAVDGVYSHFLRKPEIRGENPQEYIIYTGGGRMEDASADDSEILTSESVTLRYYYKLSMITTAKGRAAVRGREKQIERTLTDFGFSIPNGYFDAGDIDDAGMGVTVFECEYQEVSE